MELIKDYWAIFAGTIGFVIWLARLESGMIGNRKDINRMEAQRKEDVQHADRQRDKMDDNLKEMRTDIKQVLIILSTKENQH